jgi:hypothetical protein
MIHLLIFCNYKIFATIQSVPKVETFGYACSIIFKILLIPYTHLDKY